MAIILQANLKILFCFFGGSNYIAYNSVGCFGGINVICDTYIIGLNSDKTLNASLQYKVKDCFLNARIKVFDGVNHENYLKNEQVIKFINEILQ